MQPDFTCWNENNGIIRTRSKGFKNHLEALLNADSQATDPEILINNWGGVREYKDD